MLRTVLAVLAATALLAVALPIVDDVRVAHAESQVATELDHLESAASDLDAESDPSRPGSAGARVERTVHLPESSWGNAGVQRVEIPGSANDSVTWRVAGGRTRSVRPSPPLVAPPDGMILSESGRHRLTLSLHRQDGQRVVVVSRAKR